MGGLTTKSTARILVLFLVLTAAGIASAEETVVFLGDSLTAGGAWAEWFPDKRAVNLGVSGDTVRQVRGRVGLVSEARPDKVFIMAGINDLAAGLAPPTAAAEYRVLVEALQDAVPRAELYIQCVLPVNRKLFNGRDLNENVRDLNRRLARLAAESGAVFIDLTPLLADGNGNLRSDLTFDGVHLRPLGYEAWRQGIGPYLSGGGSTPSPAN